MDKTRRKEPKRKAQPQEFYIGQQRVKQLDLFQIIKEKNNRPVQNRRGGQNPLTPKSELMNPTEKTLDHRGLPEGLAVKAAAKGRP